jgi:RND family efflux transporter MFP subunit
MGTVVPSREITLRAQVSGKVVSVAEAFLPGGRVADQAELVRIDPRDYEIEVHKKESAVERARADLRLEEGQQEVARQEYRLLQESTDSRLEESDLALREPQLLQARADLSSARADLDQARLNLSRTVVRAPFKAMITERNVNLGSTVNVQDSLATLISLDEYWIEVLVPLGQLPFLDLEQSGGCPVDIFSQTGAGRWSGNTLGLTGSVDDESRMATVLLSVCNPLDGPQPLMLGDYVTTVIQGRNLEGVLELPRSALRQNSTVWLHDQGRLRMKPVQVAWKSREMFYVTGGLQPGQLVVTSDLATPVKGMLISVQSGDPVRSDQTPPSSLREPVNTDRNATRSQPELSSGSGAES